MLQKATPYRTRKKSQNDGKSKNSCAAPFLMGDEKRKRKIKIFVCGHSCAFTIKSVLITWVKTKTEILNSRFSLNLDYPSLWEDKKRK